jgi:ribosomal protein L11 methyltransferase
MDWIEVTIITTSEAVDAITGFIHEMGLFVSIQDPKDIVVNYNENTRDTVWDSKLMNTQDTIIKIYVKNL